MKNLLPILNNIIEERAKRTSKEEKLFWGRDYHRSWSAYIGKTSTINIENLLGLSHKEIVSRYLHTLPEEYRDIDHLYDFLGISKITKDGYFCDPRWGFRGRWPRTNIYYFNDSEILSVRRKSLSKKKEGTKAERLKKFYETKQSSKKSDRERKKHNEEYYSNLLHGIERKRKEKEEKINLQKIISHGFDPKTSFRPEYKDKNNGK